MVEAKSLLQNFQRSGQIAAVARGVCFCQKAGDLILRALLLSGGLKLCLQVGIRRVQLDGLFERRKGFGKTRRCKRFFGLRDQLPNLFGALHPSDVLLDDAKQLLGAGVLGVNFDELLQDLARSPELLFRRQPLCVVEELGDAALLQIVDYGTKICGELFGACVALFGIFGESPVENRIEIWRVVGNISAERRMGFIHQLLQHGHVFAGEGKCAGEQQVEHHARREDVRAAVKGLAAQALGSNVVNRADYVAGAGEAGLGVGTLHAGDAEIDDLRLAVRLHDHICGLDVAMHDSTLMRVTQCGAHLLDDAQLIDQRNRPARRDDLVQRIAIDVFHDDEWHAVFVTKVIDDNNVGMLKDSGLRFAIEALEHIGLPGEALGERLDGDLAADALVFGAIDDSHAAAAQNARDLVFTYLLGRERIHSLCPTPT